MCKTIMMHLGLSLKSLVLEYPRSGTFQCFLYVEHTHFNSGSTIDQLNLIKLGVLGRACRTWCTLEAGLETCVRESPFKYQVVHVFKDVYRIALLSFFLIAGKITKKLTQNLMKVISNNSTWDLLTTFLVYVHNRSITLSFW